MRGLILKDLLQLKKYRRTLFLFIILSLFLVMAESMVGTLSMSIILMCLGFGMVAISSFSYDDFAKADRYIQTFPIEKNKIVLSRYLLVSLSTVIGAILGIIISVSIDLIFMGSASSVKEILMVSSGIVFALSLIDAIEMPCFYKFGTEKGRFCSILFIIIIFSGGTILLSSLADLYLDSDLNLNYELFYKIWPIIVYSLTLIIWIISYLISCKIYKKREF